MQQIKLWKLELKNFKGVPSFTLDLQGENVKVYGDNATGKTTLFDAFIWLLFDKDSQNRKDFQIKTLSNGKSLHGLEHEVEGIFLIDDKQLAIRKVFAEKWTKKRGAAQSEFSGHTTNYYIDGVPAKKKEFADKVADLVEEDIFKLLTSPSYFNEQLHWQKRREILLEICGDITDAEVIASNVKLSKLPNILGNRSIEDHRKVIAAKRAEINKELDRIPIRIDEVQRTIPDISELNEQEIHDEITFLKNQENDKEQELLGIQNGSEVTEKQKQLREAEMELLDIKNEHQQANYSKTNEIQKQVYEVKGQLDSLKHNSQLQQRELDSFRNMANSKESQVSDLRSKWGKVNTETFEQHQTSCPTCGQDLPTEQIEESISRFNLEKSKKLESIQSQGKQMADELKNVKSEIESREVALEMRNKEFAEKELELQKVQQDYEATKSTVSDVTQSPEYQTKQKQIEVIKQSISELQQSSFTAAETVKQSINGFKTEIAKLEQDKAKFAQVQMVEKRVLELKDQEKELAKEFEEIEQQLFLTEEFIRTKVNLLEGKINSKFKYARFNLFKTNINGGLEEICETTFNGVPYSGGLNNAARINVGLDIINTLSEHYKVSAPIFVDNSEAVTSLIDIDSQVISLIVSEADKKLRVEYPGQLNKEAI
ncbi:AAA family ATPase [Metabacillus bambusae]|uniref:AAA family ATPase n=1 Tax=Metabacillus bambusae TaxID=2795218 RepID=A0ABS3N7W6_9BACI|nr:AAA family ATPase [Metabacillus bambusae]MBO1514308.1 AAA family ATPase [Metabacillus bambusae]